MSKEESGTVRRDGGWLFLSHSHHDIQLVRRIRNTLEDNGFNPITFFLKCMDDNPDERELDDLIKREIAARRWFILVDSENSRKSRWVRDELDYVNSLREKKIFTLDASGDVDGQLREIMRQTRVFLSCSMRDWALADRLYQRLVEHDFLVWMDDSMSSGGKWSEEIIEQMNLACEEGFVLLLVTEAFCNAEHCFNELNLAYRNKGKIIPVVVGNVKLTPMISYFLNRLHWIWIDQEPSDIDLDRVTEDLIRLSDRTPG